MNLNKDNKVFRNFFDIINTFGGNRPTCGSEEIE